MFCFTPGVIWFLPVSLWVYFVVIRFTLGVIYRVLFHPRCDLLLSVSPTVYFVVICFTPGVIYRVLFHPGCDLVPPCSSLFLPALSCSILDVPSTYDFHNKSVFQILFVINFISCFTFSSCLAEMRYIYLVDRLL